VGKWELREMTDAQLIAWLRSLKGLGWSNEAADRIEALIAERDAAETKLAKAVEALCACPHTLNPLIPAHEHLDRINAWWALEARATLAEIKGENHE
jgi:hypothetical protein